MLARAFVGARTLRLADGPDEVHELVVARFELAAARQRRQRKDNHHRHMQQGKGPDAMVRRSRL